MAMSKPNPIQVLNTYLNDTRAKGLIYLVDEAESHDGHTLMVGGRELINFGSCGYMSLEFDPRVKEGGIEAIRKYGVQFSTSRAYLSNPLYPELEGLLERIFCLPTLVSPTTTLAHMATLPALVEPEDVVLMDMQVHSSIQLAAQILKASGVHVELISHSNVARLERKIKAFKDTKKKIWFFGDGVYSMYGDYAPMAELTALLETYEQFHLYLDDAHGLSWTGERGRGSVLERLPRHPRMVVVTSMAKGFGTGGGAIICPDAETRQLLSNCGGPLRFGGPLQIPVLGAAVESAKLHLEPGFAGMQKELADKIAYCTRLLATQPLPLLSASDSPIQFVGVGKTETAQHMVQRMMARGFWLNIAQYPAVGPKHAGLRFMLTRNTPFEHIDRLVEAIRETVHEVIGQDEAAIAPIWRSFHKEYGASRVDAPMNREESGSPPPALAVPLLEGANLATGARQARSQ
jgi:7-keto-8-aminopelargonate synthetase-like enzyme